jgi:hypothetical protein
MLHVHGLIIANAVMLLFAALTFTLCHVLSRGITSFLFTLIAGSLQQHCSGGACWEEGAVEDLLNCPDQLTRDSAR